MEARFGTTSTTAMSFVPAVSEAIGSSAVPSKVGAIIATTMPFVPAVPEASGSSAVRPQESAERVGEKLYAYFSTPRPKH